MPTVVVMDVSLSMTRPVSVEGSEEYQRKHLAVHGLTMLFEHMATNYKLEFTALVVFSSLWELMVPFTRDYNTLQVHLIKNILGSASQFFKTFCVQRWVMRSAGYLRRHVHTLMVL
uniref:Integrator complex subunit 14 n=1 Tax=Terrapene triunguis TaxID=2587831 RepID=A0A674J0Q1_9SAUR